MPPKQSFTSSSKGPGKGPAKRASTSTSHAAAPVNKRRAPATTSTTTVISDDDDNDNDVRPRQFPEEAGGGEEEDEEEEEDAKTIPPGLLTRLLHDFFTKEGTRITKDANEAVAKYMDVFVREAIARSCAERGGGGFLEVEDLEKVAPQLLLDM